MGKIWPFFGQNWQFWEFLTYNFQMTLWIFLIFGMELLWILTLSGEPIILCLVFYFLREVVSSYDLDGHQNFLTPKMAKNGQNLAFLGQNSPFLVFLPYIFQTPLQTFIIFGLSALAEGPMDSRSFVRASVRASVRNAISGAPRIRFFWNLAQSCILARLKKCSKRIFEKNSRFQDFGQKRPIFAIFGHF